MKSRHSTKSCQPRVNEVEAPSPSKSKKTGRRQPTEMRVEFTWAEPSPEGDAAWRNFIDFLVDAQLKNMREHFGEAGPIALLKYIDEGKIDPRVLVGVLPPYPEEQDLVGSDDRER